MASCIVLIILFRFPADTKQLPYDYATFCIWGAVEVDIAVVSGKKASCLGGPRRVVTYIPARMLSFTTTDYPSDFPQPVS